MAQPTSKCFKIGIDFGGVLSIHDQAPTEDGHKSVAINIPHGIECLRKLKDMGHELYLISFAGQKRARETKQSVESHCPGLFKSLFFPKSKIYKTDVCQYVGCDFLIDDTYEIVANLAQAEPNRVGIWFQGDPNFEKVPANEEASKSLSNLHTVQNWQEIVELISCGFKDMTPHALNPKIDLSKKIYSI